MDPAIVAYLTKRRPGDVPPDLGADTAGADPAESVPSLAQPAPGYDPKALAAAQRQSNQLYAQDRASQRVDSAVQQLSGHGFRAQTPGDPDRAVKQYVEQRAQARAEQDAANKAAIQPYLMRKYAAGATEDEAKAALESQKTKAGLSQLEYDEAFRQKIDSNEPGVSAMVKGIAKKMAPDLADQIDAGSARDAYQLLKPLADAAGLDLKQYLATRPDIAIDAFGNRYDKHARPLPGGSGGGGGGGAAKPGGGVAGLSQEALDRAARQLHETGALPRLQAGRLGAMQANAIRNREAELYPQKGGPGFAGAAADYDANKKSQGHQQQLLDLTESWEATGKANLGVLRSISHQLANAGSPLLNKPLRWLYQNAAGDPTVTKFRAAHAAVVNEYAKILSGNTGSGGVTEGARHEAEAMMPLDSTPEQIAAAADVLETDAGNRLGSLRKQMQDTRGRIGGQGGAEPRPAGATVTVIWKGKRKTIPAERLKEALAAGATEDK